MSLKTAVTQAFKEAQRKAMLSSGKKMNSIKSSHSPLPEPRTYCAALQPEEKFPILNTGPSDQYKIYNSHGSAQNASSTSSKHHDVQGNETPGSGNSENLNENDQEFYSPGHSK